MTSAAIPALLLLLSAPLAAQITPPSQHEATLIAAQRDRFERMTVPVTIAGRGPFAFLVDTGAQATVVTARVTEALGIAPTGKATLVAMASRSSVETVRLEDLAFAGRSFGNLTAPLLRGTDVGADGILGLDTLQELRIVIDFRAYTLAVSDSPTARNDGYEIVVRARRKFGQMIITDAKVDGVRTAVIIDTGSWHSIGNSALERRMRRGGLQSITTTDVTGAVLRGTVGEIARLEIGKLGMGGLPVAFADSPAFAALGLADRPALILGLANLRPFDRVAIDFASRRVMFDVPRGVMPAL